MDDGSDIADDIWLPKREHELIRRRHHDQAVDPQAYAAASSRPLVARTYERTSLQGSWTSAMRGFRRDCVFFNCLFDWDHSRDPFVPLFDTLDQQVSLLYGGQETVQVFYNKLDDRMRHIFLNHLAQSTSSQNQKNGNKQIMMADAVPYLMLQVNAQRLLASGQYELVKKLFHELLLVADQFAYRAFNHVLGAVLTDASAKNFRAVIPHFLESPAFRGYVTTVFLDALVLTVAEELVLHPDQDWMSVIQKVAGMVTIPELQFPPLTTASVLSGPIFGLKGEHFRRALTSFVYLGYEDRSKNPFVYLAVIWQSYSRYALDLEEEQILLQFFQYITERQLNLVRSLADAGAADLDQIGDVILRVSPHAHVSMGKATAVSQDFLYFDEPTESGQQYHLVLFRNDVFARYIINALLILIYADQSQPAAETYRRIALPRDLTLTGSSSLDSVEIPIHTHQLSLAGWLQQLPDPSVFKAAESIQQFYDRTKPLLLSLLALKQSVQFVHGSIDPSFINEHDQLSLLSRTHGAAPFSVLEPIDVDEDGFRLMASFFQLHFPLVHAVNIPAVAEKQLRLHEFRDLFFRVMGYQHRFESGRLDRYAHPQVPMWSFSVPLEQILKHPFYRLDQDMK